jgi:hypothetical protein
VRRLQWPPMRADPRLRCVLAAAPTSYGALSIRGGRHEHATHPDARRLEASPGRGSPPGRPGVRRRERGRPLDRRGPVGRIRHRHRWRGRHQRDVPARGGRAAPAGAGQERGYRRRRRRDLPAPPRRRRGARPRPAPRHRPGDSPRAPRHPHHRHTRADLRNGCRAAVSQPGRPPGRRRRRPRRGPRRRQPVDLPGAARRGPGPMARRHRRLPHGRGPPHPRRGRHRQPHHRRRIAARPPRLPRRPRPRLRPRGVPARVHRPRAGAALGVRHAVAFGRIQLQGV